MSDFLPSPSPGQPPWVYSWHRDLSRWWTEQKLALTIGTAQVDLTALENQLKALTQRMGNVEAIATETREVPPFGTADQVLGMNHGATALIFKTIAAGTGISTLGADGSITISNTGVTSVALSLPAIFNVSGSPVTTTGTLTATFATQSANRFFAGPNTGAATAPTFRSIVSADLGSGTADTTKYLRGDLSWVTLPTSATPSGSAGGDRHGRRGCSRNAVARQKIFSVETVAGIFRVLQPARTDRLCDPSGVKIEMARE